MEPTMPSIHTTTLKIAATLMALAMGQSAHASRADCPDAVAWGDMTLDYAGRQLLRGDGVHTVAGGYSSLTDDCRHIYNRLGSDRGQGYFTAEPNLTLDLRQMEGLRLRVSVDSACDSTLLIQTGADNWYFDDDDNGNWDAAIVLTRPSNGLFDIWVGTYDGSFCDATLTYETY